jgi:tripartite-type tricarboxylate transporter receptor subunit TctC
MFDNGSIPFIKGGRVRALAVASDARLQALPDVPTFAELGLPGMKMTTWFGLAAPAATPAPMVEKISTALIAALGSEALKQRLMDMGAEVQVSTPERFAAFWRQELDRYKELIRLSGATVE